MSDEFTTGSSIMPQKRNPDFAEIARGKTGRVYGSLMGLLTTLKGLPLTYNRDMQEDKEGFFDTYDTVLATLRIFGDMLADVRVNEDVLRGSASGGYVLATDIADYLVAKGMPFREAYRVVAKLSEEAAQRGAGFEDLTLDEYRTHSMLFDTDVFETTVDSSISARDVHGGTAQRRVREAVKRARAELEGELEQR